MASSDGSVSLSPGIPAYAAARAKQLSLPSRSVLVAILLQNYLHGPPIPLPVVERPERLVKVRMQLSISSKLRAEATAAATRYDMSLSELVESLLLYEADGDERGLMLWPLRGSEKPILKYPR